MPRVITCTRRLQFCAGHRVRGHESKCAHLHGHNYVAHITAAADTLDPIGRVIDFSVLKQRIGTWIDQHWDHGFILAADDKLGQETITAFVTEGGQKQKTFLMPLNPTAENIAHYLLTTVCPDQLRDTGVTVTAVRIEETENCSAEASL